MEFDFNRYVEVFNQNNEDLMEEFFTEDMVLDGPDRTAHGRDNWFNLVKFSHIGVRETLRPLLVVRDGSNIMAEMNAEFMPSADRADHPMGAMKAGQLMTVRFFASYRLRGNQIAHITLAWWPHGLRSV